MSPFFWCQYKKAVKINKYRIEMAAMRYLHFTVKGSVWRANFFRRDFAWFPGMPRIYRVRVPATSNQGVRSQKRFHLALEMALNLPLKTAKSLVQRLLQNRVEAA
jgi:hypothetical protein